MQRHVVTAVAVVFVLMLLWITSVPLLNWFEVNARAEALNAAARTWRRNGLHDYSYTYRVQCSCPSPAVRPVAVTVRDTAFESAVFVDSGEPLGRPLSDAIPKSVPELFELVQDILAGNPASVEIEYDELYGHPVSISVDHSKEVLDDEITHTVSNLRIM